MPFNIISTGGGPPLNGNGSRFNGSRSKIHLGSFFRWLRHNFAPTPSKLSFSKFTEKVAEEFSLDPTDVATRLLILFAWAVVQGRSRKSPYGTAWYVEDDDGLRFYLFSKLSNGVRSPEEKVKKLSNLDPDKVFHSRCSRCGAHMPLVGVAAMRPALRGYLLLECGVPGVERVDMAKLEVLVNRAWETLLKGGYHEKEREPVKK
jgi:hypothetical protein